MSPAAPAGQGCALAEANYSVIDNRGRGHWRGSVLGKTICSTDLSVPDSCQSGPANAATHSGMGTLDLNPETSFLLRVNGPPDEGDQIFKRCCDPQAGAPSLAAMQCSRVTINQVVEEGQVYTLSPAFISDWTRDIQPSLIAEDPPSAVQFGCMDFSAAMPRELSVDEVDPFLADVLADDDLDGVFDNCDFLQGSRSTEEGGTTSTLRRVIRLEKFNDGQAEFSTFSSTTVEQVTVNSLVTPHTIIADEVIDDQSLRFDLPAGLLP